MKNYILVIVWADRSETTLTQPIDNKAKLEAARDMINEKLGPDSGRVEIREA